MTKICGYNCEFNKSVICQITGCAKRIYVANRTTNKEDSLKQALNEIREYNQKLVDSKLSFNEDLIAEMNLKIIDKYMKEDDKN